MNINTDWQKCDTRSFWAEIASNNHVVQIYDDDTMLLHTLREYADDGFKLGDSVIIIATSNHITALNEHFTNLGFNIEALIASHQYIPLDAVETLSKFMVNGAPNEKYFMQTVTEVMKKARKNGRPVRAFGEMVAILWERGNSQAAIQLEHLWNKFSATENFCLFCAYPKSSFIDDASASIMHVCTAHTKVIETDASSPSQIQYKNVSNS